MKNISFSVHFFITDDLIALCYEYGFCVENIGFGNLKVLPVDCAWQSEFANPKQLFTKLWGQSWGVNRDLVIMYLKSPSLKPLILIFNTEGS